MRTFGQKVDRIIGDKRKLHNDETHNFNSSLITVRITKSRMRRLKSRKKGIMERRNAHILLVGELQRRRLL
jgi:hypothetical protein